MAAGVVDGVDVVATVGVVEVVVVGVAEVVEATNVERVPRGVGTAVVEEVVTGHHLVVEAVVGSAPIPCLGASEVVDSREEVEEDACSPLVGT